MRNRRLRDYAWKDYGISKHRLQELKAFCLQYDIKKQESNPAYKNDCRIIEEAAIQAHPEIGECLLKSVTLGLSYEHLEHDEALGRVVIGKTDFYAARRHFYHILDRLKSGDELSMVKCKYVV